MKIWKKIRTPLVFVILACCAIGYYIYLSHRDVDQTEKMASNTEVSKLISRDLDLNYPATARAVVTYYSDIIKAYYKETMTDEELASLAEKARGLFSEELLNFNSQETYLANLTTEIEAYKSAGKYISDYLVEEGYNVEYITFKEEDYAKVDAKYYVREDSSLVYVYEEYTLKKEDSNWKIVYWEVTDASGMEN